MGTGEIDDVILNIMVNHKMDGTVEKVMSDAAFTMATVGAFVALRKKALSNTVKEVI